MRALNRNERMLALALGTCLFLVANMFAVRGIATKMRESRGEITRLRSEVAASRQVLAEKPYWEARERWIEDHPLPKYDDRVSGAEFLQEIQQSLKKRDLKIDSQQLMAAELSGSLATVDVNLTVEGQLEAIVRWLHTIQQPGSYHLVRSFELKKEGSGNTMQLQIRLGRVFRTGDLVSSP